jgi:methionyl-tRNA formyltransferase
MTVASKSPRILLMCDGAVGTEIGSWLIDNYRHDIAAVVTTTQDGFLDRARQENLPAFTCESEQRLLEDLTPLAPFDLGLLAWWPKIITRRLIGLARLGFINTHPSLLPHNRGKHYNFWAIVEQAPFGVSLHFVDTGVDSGDVVAQRPIAYDWCDTGGTLYAKAAAAMVQLFRETYPKLREGQVCRVPQDPADGSFHYASEIEPASRLALDTPTTARELLNRLRARTFPGRPSCTFEDEGRVYEVRVTIQEVK